MYVIKKEFSFEAAHKLVGLPEGHKCGQLHGHSYKVIVELASNKLDEHGFVKDYGELKDIKDCIDNELDHTYLNEVFNANWGERTPDPDCLEGYINPTAENLAKFLYERFIDKYPQLIAVTVKETEKTSARYTPDFEEK
jgi:6-pyruvoyltetrahydropterin/6-carboxytetrahydropterin synthase